MIVTCPSCASRYLVDPQALAGNGRTVRCANCGHTWFQTPPADLPRAVDLTPPPTAMPPIPEGSNLPAFAARRAGGGLSSALGWLVLIASFLGSLSGIVLFRNEIVMAWPPAARFYEVVGIPVDHPGAGLEVRDPVSAHRAAEDGAPSLIEVSGTVVNVSNRIRPVPSLRIEVSNAARQPLKDWVFQPERRSLEPGQSMPFRAELPNPPRGATSLRFIFTQG
jgi:predicted Zn finger-like uncharacterized protein